MLYYALVFLMLGLIGIVLVAIHVFTARTARVV